MMKGKYIVILLVLLLSSCNRIEDNKINQSKEELLQELKNANELLEQSRIQNELLIQKLEAAKIEIDIATQKLDEYEEIINSNSYGKREKEVIANYHNGFINVATAYVYESSNVYQKLRIIGYGEIENFNHHIIDLSKNKVPNLSFEISGELYNFKIEKINWNDDYKGYQVEEVLCSFDTIKDSDVLMNSLLAEGIPSELLSWSDDNGKKYYYLIGDTRLGPSWPDILISELSDLEPWWEN